MLYTILCYHSEEALTSWTKEHDDAVMAKLAVVQDKLAKKGKLGPVARLGSTKSASTLWKDHELHMVTDGPYAETKEQILGLNGSRPFFLPLLGVVPMMSLKKFDDGPRVAPVRSLICSLVRLAVPLPLPCIRSLNGS
jgi:hypothetical protein